jgi:hypothetical protein
VADDDPFLRDLAGVAREVARVTARAAAVDTWREAAGRELSAEARGRLDGIQDDLGRLGVELRRLSITRRDRDLIRAAWRRLSGPGDAA